MTKKISIKNKTVLVTGANRGIGKEIVMALLENGAGKIFAGVRKKNSLSNVFEKYGDRVEEIKLDVTSQVDIEKAISKIKSLEILINNAGIMPTGNFTSGHALETLDLNWNVNVRGLVALTQAFIANIVTSNSGAIVSVSSIAGLANMPFMGTYSATKSAVHSIMQGLRAELKESNILVSTVYPGPVNTELLEGFDIAKASPESVALNIVQGIEEGLEEIFPDEISAQMGALYFTSPKDLENQFAVM